MIIIAAVPIIESLLPFIPDKVCNEIMAVLMTQCYSLQKLVIITLTPIL